MDQQTTLLLCAVGAISVAGALYFILGQKKRGPPLDPKEFRKFTLIDKKELTSGVACPVTRFRFSLPHSEDVLNLPPGNHMSLRTTNPETGDPHQRSYTPTTLDERGYFDLVVKIYPKGVMGQYLANLSIGGQIEASGPKGRFTYEQGKYDHIGMLAGGSGITPMYQILRDIRRNRGVDTCKCSLIFGNITVDDIILRAELEAMTQEMGEQVNVLNVLNNPPEGWTEGSGFITPDHIKPRFPPPGPRMKILVCGPPPMVKAMEPHLQALGYTKEHYFLF